MSRRLPALVLVTALVSLAPAHAAGRLTAGDHDLTLGARTFAVHVPPDVASRGPLPVLVAFHGGGGTAAGFKAYAGLDRIADREGFVVVYPDGSGRLGRRLLTWNAGACCGYALASGVDDVAFTLAVLRELAGDLELDATRVYATGHSNGGMMAYRLAAEAADRIAAVASVAGMMATIRFAPAQPVAVLHIHSVNDPRALYAGGLGPPFPGTDLKVTHQAVESGLARWIAVDRCPSQPAIADTRRAQVRGAEHTATLLVYEPCAGGVVVAHWRLTGAGHGWPGSHSPLPERIMGPDTTVLDAAEEVWRFVARFRHPDAPALR